MAADVTEQTFEQDVIARSKEKPVVVDFWAEWCGPCHQLAPILEKEVDSRDGAVELVKVDVDANRGLASTFGVQGIPAVKGFRNGRIVTEFVGAVGSAAVSSFIDRLLAPPLLAGALEELRASGDHPEILAALEAGDHEQALELIMTAIGTAPPEERNQLRELAVAIFDHLGHEDPIAMSYRRRLATTLY